MKPLGIKNYGSIGHLPNSRMGSGDHHIMEGQANIATKNCVGKNGEKREVIVQEKLDGSNVGIARIGDRIIALSRSGYECNTSPYPQHQMFEKWVMKQQDRFLSLIKDGERFVGEWLYQAHGTRYKLNHEPFVVFDVMVGNERLPYDDFLERTYMKGMTIPHCIHRGDSISVDEAMKRLGKYGFHGAIDEVEGVVYRVERISKKGRYVEFLTKYVRPDKVDGLYLDEEVYNIEL